MDTVLKKIIDIKKEKIKNLKKINPLNNILNKIKEGSNFFDFKKKL